MRKAFFTVLVIAIVLIIQISSQEIMLSPPSRPAEFRNPKELREYMKALNEYYAIVGRPRFGRSIFAKRFGSNFLNEALNSDENKETSVTIVTIGNALNSMAENLLPNDQSSSSENDWHFVLDSIGQTQSSLNHN